MIKIYLTILLLILNISTGCSNSDLKEHKRAFHIMGSSLEIRLFTNNEDLFYEITEDAIERTRQIDQIFSNYKNDSVLSLVNSGAGESPVEVPEEFINFTKTSINYSEITDGASDITVGNIFELWKEKANSKKLPEKSEIETALECTGYKNIIIRDNKISYSKECIRIDYGAIGKGYVVDEILEIVKAKGVKNAIINFGGNIYSLNSPADQKYREVGINNPAAPGKIVTRIGLQNYGIATSGDYEKYFKIGGKKYSHIIHPETGMPVNNISSVTVAAKSATEADVLSTAFSVMGLDKTKEFIENRSDIAVMFITKKGDSSEIYKSTLFKEFESNLK